jgi:two-component system phosphate regulon response regulator PhoB
MMQLIFVVEGEMESRSLAHESLEQAGYLVHTFSTAQIIEDAEKNCPALMLISAELPDGSGLDLCRNIRQHPVLGSTRIVLLTDVNNDADRAQGLESGADDCVTKPFTPRELVARVRAVLRRSVAPISATSSVDPAELVIDSSAMKLSVRGNEIATTTLEFRLIDYLARHRGQVFTRDALLDAVWGDMQFVTPRSVDACVRRIREKIEPDRTVPSYLKTIRGVGYRLDAVAAWRSDNYEMCTCSACMASKTRGSRMVRPELMRWRRMPRPEA